MDLTWMRRQTRDCPKKCGTDSLLAWAKLVGVALLILTGILFSCLAFASLILGALHFDECEFEPLLPVFLVVDGCLAITIVVAILAFGCKERERSGTGKGRPCFVICGGIIEATIGVLLLSWLVVGTLWLYEVTEMVELTGNNKVVTSTMASKTATMTLNMTVTSSDTAVMMSNYTALGPNGTAVSTDVMALKFNVTNVVKTCSEELIDISSVVVVVQWILFAVVFVALFITLIAVCLVFIDVWKLPNQRLDDV